MIAISSTNSHETRRIVTLGHKHAIHHAILALGVATLTLSACGDSGGGGDGSSGGGSSNLIIGMSSGLDAADVETDILLRSAVTGSVRGAGPDLGALQRFADGDDTAAPGDGGAQGMSDLDANYVAELQDGTAGLSAALLGVDDADAVVTRVGNIITVDPDDAAVCDSGDDMVGDDNLPASDDDNTGCLQFVADLTVRLDARTEDSGVISYLFRDTPVVSIGYSPEAGAGELNLGGLKLVLDRLEEIERANADPLDQDMESASPVVMRGVVRSIGRVSDDREGSESGDFELSVVETIEIGDGTGLGFTLEPSRVFRLELDAESETASLSIAWGALRIVTESGDSDGNSSRSAINLGGLTLDFDAMEDAPTASLRNLGIGDVPFTIEVNSQPALSVGLQTFGITIDSDDGSVSFDTPASVSLMLDNLSEFIEENAPEFNASFTAEVTAGTELLPHDNGTTEVRAGGPVTASFVASDNTSSVQSELSAGVGSCFGGDESAATPDVDMSDDDSPFDGLRLASQPCP